MVRTACFIHIISTLFLVCYIAVFKPYHENFRNTQEFWNEVTILVSVYCMTGYTDFHNSDEGRFDPGRECLIQDENDQLISVTNEQCAVDYLKNIRWNQFMIGWLSLGIAGLNIAINIGAMSYNSVKALNMKYRERCRRKKSKDNIEEKNRSKSVNK